MRAIKFRAYDFVTKEWVYFTLDQLLNHDFDLTLRTLKWESECIGLLDQNGKEIYSGDIIEYYYYNRPCSSNRKKCKVTSEVVWYSGQSNTEQAKKLQEGDPSTFNENPMFTVKIIHNEKDYRYGEWSAFHKCKIIGNRYENPEIWEENL